MNILIVMALSLVVIAGIIVVNEATRQITVFYAKRVRGNGAKQPICRFASTRQV
jgi:hypothetical protein